MDTRWTHIGNSGQSRDRPASDEGKGTGSKTCCQLYLPDEFTMMFKQRSCAMAYQDSGWTSTNSRVHNRDSRIEEAATGASMTLPEDIPGPGMDILPMDSNIRTR